VIEVHADDVPADLLFGVAAKFPGIPLIAANA
jgi:hypothetical protein